MIATAAKKEKCKEVGRRGREGHLQSAKVVMHRFSVNIAKRICIFCQRVDGSKAMDERQLQNRTTTTIILEQLGLYFTCERQRNVLERG